MIWLGKAVKSQHLREAGKIFSSKIICCPRYSSKSGVMQIIILAMDGMLAVYILYGDVFMKAV